MMSPFHHRIEVDQDPTDAADTWLPLDDEGRQFGRGEWATIRPWSTLTVPLDCAFLPATRTGDEDSDPTAINKAWWPEPAPP